MIDILGLLKRVNKTPKGWSACCPAHDDKHHSLSVAKGDDGRWLLTCHYAGCSVEDICVALRIEVKDLFPDRPEAPKRARAQTRSTSPARTRAKKGRVDPGESSATVHKSAAGLTLADFAAAKGLPLDFLQRCGVAEQVYDGAPAVRFPFFSADGELLATHLRIALDGDRFRWKKGDKASLYGLQRGIADAQKRGSIVICEGESDTLTLWHHNIPAVGLPGGNQWKEDRDAGLFDGIGEILVLIEPDAGGEAVKKWLGQSMIRHRAKLLTLPTKDASALYLDDPKRFRERWNVASLGAMPWTMLEAEASAVERSEAWNLCEALAKTPEILDAFGRELKRGGFAGDDTLARIIYLALTSRLLQKPVALAIKGPSSGGKSFALESVLRFFPPAAFYALSALSERSLAYSNEPLRHRHLILYEASGLGPFATYLLRSLLSEGHLRYETVEKTAKGLVPKLITREGPTGLILTTTKSRLHPENETRMLSLNVLDTPEQTAAILGEIARKPRRNGKAIEKWQALQTWLACGSAEVVIPFAPALATLIPSVAVRLRRDFGMLLTLIKAHALLHQAARTRDGDGSIVATFADYSAVKELVADLIAQGLQVSIKAETRSIVEAVKALGANPEKPATYAELAKALKLDKATISRRAREAIEGGYLINQEERQKQPARLVPGEPLPDEIEILPGVERLMHCCTRFAGIDTNFFPDNETGDGASDDADGWSFNLDDEPSDDREARQ